MMDQMEIEQKTDDFEIEAFKWLQSNSEMFETDLTRIVGNNDIIGNVFQNGNRNNYTAERRNEPSHKYETQFCPFNYNNGVGLNVSSPKASSSQQSESFVSNVVQNSTDKEDDLLGITTLLQDINLKGMPLKNQYHPPTNQLKRFFQPYTVTGPPPGFAHEHEKYPGYGEPHNINVRSYLEMLKAREEDLAFYAKRHGIDIETAKHNIRIVQELENLKESFFENAHKIQGSEFFQPNNTQNSVGCQTVEKVTKNYYTSTKSFQNDNKFGEHKTYFRTRNFDSRSNFFVKRTNSFSSRDSTAHHSNSNTDFFLRTWGYVPKSSYNPGIQQILENAANGNGIGNDKLPKPEVWCNFCFKSGLSNYLGHNLHQAGSSKVECPVLRSYVCPLCSATGDDAHTKSYCQFNQHVKRYRNDKYYA